MYTAFASVSWREAAKGFTIHVKAVRSRNTFLSYADHLHTLAAWAEQQGHPLETFTQRHLDQFLADRAEQGKSQTTLHHDAPCAKILFKWCKRNDLLDRNPRRREPGAKRVPAAGFSPTAKVWHSSRRGFWNRPRTRTRPFETNNRGRRRVRVRVRKQAPML